MCYDLHEYRSRACQEGKGRGLFSKDTVMLGRFRTLVYQIDEVSVSSTSYLLFTMIIPNPDCICRAMKQLLGIWH